MEHSKFKQELQLKDIIISEQEEMITRHAEIDSINTKSFNALSTELIRSKEVMDSLRSNLEKSKQKLKVLKGVSIGGFSLSLALITLIFIK